MFMQNIIKKSFTRNSIFILRNMQFLKDVLYFLNKFLESQGIFAKIVPKDISFLKYKFIYLSLVLIASAILSRGFNLFIIIF